MGQRGRSIPETSGGLGPSKIFKPGTRTGPRIFLKSQQTASGVSLNDLKGSKLMLIHQKLAFCESSSSH